MRPVPARELQPAMKDCICAKIALISACTIMQFCVPPCCMSASQPSLSVVTTGFVAVYSTFSLQMPWRVSCLPFCVAQGGSQGCLSILGLGKVHAQAVSL